MFSYIIERNLEVPDRRCTKALSVIGNCITKIAEMAAAVLDGSDAHGFIAADEI